LKERIQPCIKGGELKETARSGCALPLAAALLIQKSNKLEPAARGARRDPKMDDSCFGGEEKKVCVDKGVILY